MFEGVVGDRVHAFGHRLILLVDVVDPRIEDVVALGLAIDLPVIRLIAGDAPAPV